VYFTLRPGWDAPTDRVNLWSSGRPAALQATRNLCLDFIVLPLGRRQYTDCGKRQLDLLYRYTQVSEKLLTFTGIRLTEVMFIQHLHVTLSKPMEHASQKDLFID
jgi:hypothetical protein